MNIKELKSIQDSLRSMQEGGKPMHEMTPYYLKAILDAVVIIAEGLEEGWSDGHSDGSPAKVTFATKPKR